MLCCVVIFTSCKGTDKSEPGSGNITTRAGELDALKCSKFLLTPESSEKLSPEAPGTFAPDVSESVFTLKEGDTFTVKDAKVDTDEENVVIVFSNGHIEKSVELKVIELPGPRALTKKIQNADDRQHFGQLEGLRGGKVSASVYRDTTLKVLLLALTIDNHQILPWKNRSGNIVLALQIANISLGQSSGTISKYKDSDIPSVDFRTDDFVICL